MVFVPVDYRDMEHAAMKMYMVVNVWVDENLVPHIEGLGSTPDKDAAEEARDEYDTRRAADNMVVIVLESPEVCPECSSANVSWKHHEATFAVPECSYWDCEDCDHQWGHA